MAELEKIYGSDSGTDAIKKLDRNIRNVNLGIENIDVSSQINAHNSNADAHSSILGSATLNTEDKTVKGAINETLNKVDVLNTNVGDTTTLKTSSKEVVGAINENADEITALQTNKADKNNPAFSGVMTINDKQVATTDKIDISIPYNAEFITNEENRYVSKLVKTSLNKVTAYVSVKRTDGQMFKANTDYQIAILPIGWKNKGNNHCVGSASNLNGISIGTARMAVYDGTLFATTFTDCYSMMFTGEYELIV